MNDGPRDHQELIGEILTSLIFNSGLLYGLRGRPGIEEHLNVRALAVAITHLETTMLWVKEAKNRDVIP